MSTPSEQAINEIQAQVAALVGRIQTLIGSPEGPLTDEGPHLKLLEAGNFLALASVALREAADEASQVAAEEEAR